MTSAQTNDAVDDAVQRLAMIAIEVKGTLKQIASAVRQLASSGD